MTEDITAGLEWALAVLGVNQAKTLDAKFWEPRIRALLARVRELQRDVDYLTNAGVIDCVIRNQSVSDYISMEHWEGRTLKAEAERDALREQVASERADHERIEEALKDEYHLLREQVAEREEAAFRAGHEQGRRHDLWVNADEAFLRWQARQKGTPT